MRKSSRSFEPPAILDNNHRNIAIYVALDFEREIISDQLDFKTDYPASLTFSKKKGEKKFTMFSPNKIGRVPAAIATMQFLEKNSVDLLLVVGIAGGFEIEGASLGDVLIPSTVVDLASRKIKTDLDTGIAVEEFRPEPFKLDRRIEDYLIHSTRTSQWEQDTIKKADWPKGKRPTIHYGTSITSLDEVLSVDGWVEKLLKAWPKLIGVEMEAGGVCAAADKFEVPVSVIRGVSDLADPLKSDGEWRKRAMKTVCCLLEMIDFDLVLSKPPSK